jgi:quercetin dioxygenase-like cupin family protein
MQNSLAAEAQLSCDDLAPALDFFVGKLGFRVETIFPAERPRVASLSGHGLRIRLAPGAGGPGAIRLPCRELPPEGERVATAPNGTLVEWVAADAPIEVPRLAPEFVLSRPGEGAPPGQGRAGMTYRDVIPGGLGGRFIASLISIPEGGPVADWVHFHKVRFQMIYCVRGWVRVVYEDQGPPFLLTAGDCVLQPPRIRHRVLEASAGLEVAEISCPALHETIADHDMVLPTSPERPDRDFDGQVFLRHTAREAAWAPEGDDGFERRDTGVALATRGLADAVVLRPARGRTLAVPARGGELMFGFILEGAAVLSHAGEDHALGRADAFVIPPDDAWSLRAVSSDLSLLRVSVG